MNLPDNVTREVNDVLESAHDKERVIWVLMRVQSFYPWRFEDLFVSETRDAEERQVLQSVWLFARDALLEVKDINAGPNFDVTPLASLRYVDIQMSDYDVRIPAQTRNSSRMHAEVGFGEGVLGQLWASGANCGRLHRILQERVLPHLVQAQR
jgi:hypothetical protein